LDPDELFAFLKRENDKIMQLVANETSFTALTVDQNVKTWGDARFPACLGRDISTDMSVPPHPLLQFYFLTINFISSQGPQKHPP